MTEADINYTCSDLGGVKASEKIPACDIYTINMTAEELIEFLNRERIWR